MIPLRVAILWHQHQPYYKKEETFILPWVRLHGAKDYYDLPTLLREFPAVKQTFNLAPSLMLQIEEYCINGTRDKVQILTEITAEHLTETDKRDILKLFFLCNQELMVLPFARYRNLFEQAHNIEAALLQFTPQDWRDIQTWYNLTWIGQLSRGDRRVKTLFEKGENFTEEEKHQVLTIHKEILAKILPEMIELHAQGQIEISVTPLYHPILPLIIDNRSMLEAMPNAQLPDILFSHPEDADIHIQRAIEYYQSEFGDTPKGMWPSEGSISNATLALMAKNGIQWAASDEEVLWASIKDTPHHWTDKYFPRNVSTEHGDIALLFRDHSLSDAVGFVYSRWDANHAADDFCRRLRDIRTAIIQQHGEESLRSAVVPIILDGENCWEYYFQNGTYFLRALYERLSSDEFQTIQCSEAALHAQFLPKITSIRAGSWINANFKIWIGHHQDNAAWSMLATARHALEQNKSHQHYHAAFEHILIAEGSDWCWWYGDDHSSANQHEFDELFRFNIAEAYRKIGLASPENVSQSILETQNNAQNRWTDAHLYLPERTGSAMHSVTDGIRRIVYRRNGSLLEIRFDCERSLQSDEQIMLSTMSPNASQLLLTSKNFSFHCDSTAQLPLVSVKTSQDTIEVALPIQPTECSFSILYSSKEHKQVYPQTGMFAV
jgi:alpha-amylase/alpha-mannosidase (GH57 family)